MSVERPSYMLSPNWDFRPDGPVVLGSILKDPKIPDRPLNSSTRVHIEPSLIEKTTKEDWCFTRGGLHNGRVGLRASFLAPVLGLGTGHAVNLCCGSNDIFKCDVLETRFWRPDDTYIGASLCGTFVKAYTQKYWWKSIYMITGIKIAYGATVKTIKESSYGLGGILSAGSPSTGFPVAAGPEAKYERKDGHSVSFNSSEGFVIAYRLLRIKPKKNGAFKEEDYNKLSLLDENEEEETPTRLERQQIVDDLHKNWDVEEVQGPTDEEEWKDVTLFNVTHTDGECGAFML